jgi:hypothetical protein
LEYINNLFGDKVGAICPHHESKNNFNIWELRVNGCVPKKIVKNSLNILINLPLIVKRVLVIKNKRKSIITLRANFCGASATSKHKKWWSFVALALHSAAQKKDSK